MQVNLSAVRHASELLGPPGELGGHGLIDYLIVHDPQRAERTGASGMDRRLVARNLAMILATCVCLWFLRLASLLSRLACALIIRLD